MACKSLHCGGVQGQLALERSTGLQIMVHLLGDDEELRSLFSAWDNDTKMGNGMGRLRYFCGGMEMTGVMVLAMDGILNINQHSYSHSRSPSLTAKTNATSGVPGHGTSNVRELFEVPLL